MKKLTLAISVLCLSAISASAADLARPYTKAPMMTAPVYDWTGVYVGGEIGALWGQSDGSFLTPPPADFSTKHTTAAAGGFFGAQYQWNNIVLGVEGNVIALFTKSLGDAPCVPAASCGPNALRTTSLDAIWSAGGRIGWAAGMWMPYAAGGFAGTRLTLVGIDATPLNESVTQTRLGWYVGAGVDWMVAANWIVGVEYRHYDFGSQQIVPFNNTTGAFATDDASDLRLRVDTVMFRASYKFGGPIVARY